MTDDIFTTITLMDGRKCDILNIKAGHFYMSSLKFRLEESPTRSQEAYLMREILIIDGKKRDLDYLDEISIDDFLAISEVVEAIMAKVPSLNG